MSEVESKPQLFSAQGTDEVPDAPALCGGKCNACGYEFFPFQSYGCEMCGSQDLAPKALGGRGKLIASAKVHLHPDPKRPAPFTIGSIAIDGGAVVRAVVQAGEKHLLAGTSLESVLIMPEHSGRADAELEFRPVGDQEKL